MFILSMSLISKAFAPDSIFGRDSAGASAILGRIRPLVAGRCHTSGFPVGARRRTQEVADLMQITKLYTVFDIYLLLRGI